MDTNEGRGWESGAGSRTSPGERARLKQDLDDFVEFMSQRVFDGQMQAGPAPKGPAPGSNDN